jgi:hypothetical protein
VNEEMAKNRKQQSTTSNSPSQAQDKPATLKDLLNPDTVNRLKAQAEAMREKEAKRREDERKKAEEARKAEQKRLESNFEHLLNNSNLDWKKYK